MNTHMIAAPTRTPMTKSPTGIRLILLLSGLGLLAAPAAAQNYTIAPPPFQTVLSNAGAIVNNACVWTYQAGTTTPATTYSDNAGTSNSNPIRADSAGRFTAYLLSGASYKFVFESSCTPPAHGSVLRTADNISGVPASSATVDVTGTAGETLSAGQCAYLSDGSGSKTAGQWFRCDTTNGYSSVIPEVGIAPSAILSAASGTIRLAGSVTGLSSLSVGSTYYVGAAGALTSTAGTNRRVLGVADTASSLVLAADPTLPTTWTRVDVTTTGTIDDWAPGLAGNTIARLNNASLLTLRGIAGGYDGQHVLLMSIGAGQVDLLHQNAGSAAANRLINIATTAAAPTSLAPGSGLAEYVYDGATARWRLKTHEQGAAIAYTPTWNGTLNDGTVAGKYYLRGRTVYFEIKFVWGASSAIGGGTGFLFNLPAFVSVSNDVVGGASRILDTSVPTNFGGTVFVISTTAVTAYPAGTGSTVTSANPMAWATGDTIWLSGWYLTS